MYEDLSDILLLGFSYGGMVVSGSLQHIGDRVKHLVYLDAMVPSNGDSADRLRGTNNDNNIEVGRNWVLTPTARALDDPADAAWFESRRSSQPAATLAIAATSESRTVPVYIDLYQSYR